MQHFPVVEAFKSIQGEGPFAGHPAFFLRVKKCNYNGECIVGCDTIPRTRNLEELLIPYDSVLQKAKEVGRIVITGGEPTLYYAEVVNLLKYLDTWLEPDKQVFVEIETNGYLLHELLSELPHFTHLKIWINWSPKEYSINNFRLKYDQCKQLRASYITGYCIKVVVWDSMKVKTFVIDLVEAGFSKALWLMPRGKTAEELKQSWPVVYKLAMEYNLKISGRLQIEGQIL